MIIFGRAPDGKMITMSTNALRCDLLGYADVQLTGFKTTMAAGLDATAEMVPLPEVDE